jgi:hypothetical protein
MALQVKRNLFLFFSFSFVVVYSWEKYSTSRFKNSEYFSH